uniref:Uncharacterized protein n=1 Tax=Anguilla anguilla TaxID=7936 RepID=A0A0E9TBN4_ANGAN
MEDLRLSCAGIYAVYYKCMFGIEPVHATKKTVKLLQHHT